MKNPAISLTREWTWILPGILALSTTLVGQEGEKRLRVAPPPESFFELVRERDREPARAFYRKYLDIGGIPVAAAAEVEDRALWRTHEIVSHMLAGRPDLVEAMVERRWYLIIIGRDQLYTDMPEYRHRPNPDYLNERVRGTGGNPTSFGEENLLSLPLDRYDDESIAVHEFCHSIDSALRSVDPEWISRRNAAHENAVKLGLHEGTYAAGSAGEYWAEICQAYFDCQRVNNWNHGPVGMREQLKIHDPVGYELVRTTFRLSPDQDWRYRWLQELPRVSAPPEKLGIHPHYTRFTWAREFTVIGREASEEALLAVNDTIRKMFAYRHDVLKALIAAKIRLVVLGPDERLADLPELREVDENEVDLLARFLEYSPDPGLIVVDEKNVLGDPSRPGVGSSQVIRLLARAVYRVVGTRPVDPDWESRPHRLRQQYELGVTRLDDRFDRAIRELHRKAREKDLWRGTPAHEDGVEYWATGVLAYFDAAGQGPAPGEASHPVQTREDLARHDPGLHDLVEETMAYRGRVDWRFTPWRKER